MAVIIILLKQAVYFACALLLAAQLNGPHRVAALKAIYWGLLVGLLMFLAVFSVISAVIGDGLISLITGAIVQGIVPHCNLVSIPHSLILLMVRYCRAVTQISKDCSTEHACRCIRSVCDSALV